MARIYGTLDNSMTCTCDRCKAKAESPNGEDLPAGWVQLRTEFHAKRPGSRTSIANVLARDLCAECGKIAYDAMLNLTRIN